MDISVWAPNAWIFLHSIAFSYPINPSSKQKNDMKKFLLSLQNVLPCSYCQKHFKEFMDKTNMDEVLKNKNQYVKWMIDLHNDVNRRTGKKEYSYKEVIYYYNSLCNRKYNFNKNTIKIIKTCLVVISLMAAYKIIFKNNFFKKK